MQKRKRIKTKIALEWYLAVHFLGVFDHIPILFCDKGFCERYKALKDYADEKIKTKHNGDIVDTYVVAEQEPCI